MREWLERNGYTIIPLFKHWCLVRLWSKQNPKWYAKIPIYILTHTPPRASYIIYDHEITKPKGRYRV